MRSLCCNSTCFSYSLMELSTQHKLLPKTKTARFGNQFFVPPHCICKWRFGRIHFQRCWTAAVPTDISLFKKVFLDSIKNEVFCPFPQVQLRRVSTFHLWLEQAVSYPCLTAMILLDFSHERFSCCFSLLKPSSITECNKIKMV